MEEINTKWLKHDVLESNEGNVVMSCGSFRRSPPFSVRSKYALGIFSERSQTFLYITSKLLCRVDTLYFDDHFNAYCINERADSFSVVPVKELIYYRPYDKQFSNEMCEKCYIV